MISRLITTLFVLLTMIYGGMVYAGDIDLTKSLTIGSGPQKVIVFTDPDCPHCRKASSYFSGRSDVTSHIFFYPLPRHPKAKAKVQYILSQRDRNRAYAEVMSGSLDALKQFDGITAEGIRLQEEHLKIVKANKIVSTPTFIINGRIIVGFDNVKEALGHK